MVLNNRNLVVALLVCLSNGLHGKSVEWAQQKTKEFAYSSTVQAKVISWALYSDKELAARYVQYNQIHGQKTREKAIDFGVNHVVYPLVDYAVGQGMNGLDNVKYVHTFTEDIPSRGKKFLKQNTQIIASAGAIKLGRAACEKGISTLGQKDATEFGKACAVQVGCNAADEYLIKPFVKEHIAQEGSLTSEVVSFVANYVLSSVIVSQVNKF